MHPTSLENMARCRDRYAGPAWLDALPAPTVLDLGAADVNGSYRALFRHPRLRYTGADLAPGPGVDVVLEDPYRLPFDDASMDLVLSGQMLEHCEFFWRAFDEMVRVLRPGGRIFLIAPSAGPIHRYPVDCYRFHPDAFHALARHAGVHLVDVWHDERGPWKDVVGVFSREPLAAVRAPVPAAPAARPAPPQADSGAPEETLRGARPYLDVLAWLHEALAPRRYFEIGVRGGESLRLARCPALGVDPAPALLAPPADTHRVLPMSSDDFFAFDAAEALATPPDFAFIDGLHLFEQVLRDFMNVERHAAPGTLVAIDDIYPNHPAQAERTRRTRAWTGDVWKLHALLAEQRPDLVLLPLDTWPTGLLLVAGLDPANRVLWDGYNPLVRRYAALDAPPPAVLARTGALSPDDPRIAALAATLRAHRDAGAAAVRAALAG